MSGEGPESVPTSADPRSHRPTKKRALTPVSAQAATVDALFAKPDQEIRLPASASGALAHPKRAAPPEIVTNVQGSSAGAGSGEFHVYKASRRREYERLREMDEAVRREKEQEQFVKEKAERDRKDEERTRKNREKREKLKARKANKAKGGKGGGPNNTDKPVTAAAGSNESSQGRSQDQQDGPLASSASVQSESVAPAQVPGIVIHDDD